MRQANQTTDKPATGPLAEAAAQAAPRESVPAKNVPVHAPAREVHSEDLPKRHIPVIDTASTERDTEIIRLPEPNPKQDYLDELAFMEEPVTIVLARPAEKHAPQAHCFRVNGEACWIPVGRRVTIKRKFVEVIARAQPYSVETEVIQHEKHEENKIIRTASGRYPFSVLRDDNPRGFDWLSKLLMMA